MPFELTTRVVRQPDLMTAPVDKEIVILSLAANHYVGLDEIGRRIWELLERPQEIQSLCQMLTGEFHASPDQISGDLLRFLNQLENEGLIHALAD